MSKAEVIQCTNEEYHAMRDSWSHSQIEELLESAALFHDHYIADPPTPKKRSSSFDWGTVGDAALTNPGGMDAVMRIIPSSVLNGDGNRLGAAWKSYKAANADKILLKENECAEIVRAVRNCRDNPAAAHFLDAPGEFQYTIKWLDDETGLWLRCRLDKVAYVPKGLFPCDVKTTRSVHPRAFWSDVFDYGYHRQASHYTDGLIELGESPEGWINIALGKPDPQDCVVYEMPPQAIGLGRQEMRVLLRELADRLDKNNWRPRTWNQVLRGDLPGYAYKPREWEIPYVCN